MVVNPGDAAGSPGGRAEGEAAVRLSEMTAAVLAGGAGERLRSAVADRPKVLAEVAGRPFLAILLDQLLAAGVRRAVLCTGYLADQVRAAFGDAYGDLALAYSRETAPLGTGGALRQALPLLNSDPALVLNGDSYCQADLLGLAAWHAAHDAAGTLLLTKVPDTTRYGRVEVDADGRVLRFDEKGASAGPGWVNAGVYVLGRALLASIPAGKATSLERETFPAWTGRGLRGWQGGGRFLDIGTPQAYASAEDFFRGFTSLAGAARGSPG